MLQQALHETPLGASKRWQDYVIPQCWDAFTPEDHRVWDILFERQVEALGSRIVRPFRDGLDLLHLSHPGIPDLAELNTKLKARTGWEAVAVPGLVPDVDLFRDAGERVFPVGNFIRTFEQLDYLEEPDLFHDIFGHVPMLSHPAFRGDDRAYGATGTGSDRGRAWRVGGAALLAQRRVQPGARGWRGENPRRWTGVELRRVSRQPRQR